MKDVRYPTASADAEDLGFDAVKQRYGEDMVTRFKNWPRIAENVAKAQNVIGKELEREIKTAQENSERARRDENYALAQAAAIARNLPKYEWASVPSVMQLKKEWGL